MSSNLLKLQNGSDIRGIAMEGVPGEEVNLDAAAASRIAQVFVHWLSIKTNKNPVSLNICIGHDSRLTSDSLSEALKKGICMMGARVSDAGLASTPAMFMSTVMPYYDFDGAIMLTASHLPFNRNGMKFFTAEGGLDKDDIKSILKKANSVNFVGDYYESENVNLMDMYAAELRRQIGDLSGMKIVVDAGNGAGGFFATDVLARLGADVSDSLFLEPDGHFPNHQPNPEDKAALDAICTKVKECNADLGIIFDTDVDRSAAVSPSGKALARNEIVALAAALKAEEHPGGTVVTDSITSNELHTFLEDKLGLKHLRFKRGYRNVIKKAQELSASGEDAYLAIETSGHAAYSDNYYLDDGAYLAALIVKVAAKLKKEGLSIDSLISELGSPAESVEIRFSLTAENFAELGKEILAGVAFWAENAENFSLEEPNYEGVRVNYELPYLAAPGGVAKGWFLLRQSLHDPVLPLNIESDTKGACFLVEEAIREFLKQYEGIEL